MFKINKVEKGFSAVELILVIVILVLIGATSYVVVKHINTKKSSSPVILNSNIKSGITGYTYIYTQGGAFRVPPKGETTPASIQGNTSFDIENSTTNQIIYKATSDINGYFTVRLLPGTYILVPGARSNEKAVQKTVTVTSNKYTNIYVEYSSSTPNNFP
jgi:hypothetical protein